MTSFWITKAESLRLTRQRRYEQGDCVYCGVEERVGDMVLGPECREKSNARRRTGAKTGRPKGSKYSEQEKRSRRGDG